MTILDKKKPKSPVMNSMQIVKLFHTHKDKTVNKMNSGQTMYNVLELRDYQENVYTHHTENMTAIQEQSALSQYALVEDIETQQKFLYYTTELMPL